MLVNRFEDDKGLEDTKLIGLLQSQDSLAILNHLFSSRLIAGIVAQAGPEVEMKQLLFHSQDGRKGMPVFTSLDRLNKWQIDARPLPMSAVDLAKQVIEQQLDGLIIDIQDQHRITIDGNNLFALANNLLMRVHLDEELVLYINKCIEKYPELEVENIELGEEFEVRIIVSGPGDLTRLITDLSSDLSEDEFVREKAPFGVDIYLKETL